MGFIYFTFLTWIKANRDTTTITGPVISVSSDPHWLITHEIMPSRQIMCECTQPTTQPTTVTETPHNKALASLEGVFVTKYTIFPNHYRFHRMSSSADNTGNSSGGEGGKKRDRAEQGEIKFFILPHFSLKNNFHFSHDSCFFSIFLSSKLPSTELPSGSEDGAGGDGRKRKNTYTMEVDEDEEEKTLLEGGKLCHRITSVWSFAARAKLDLAMFSALNNRLARFYNSARNCYQKILLIDTSAAKSLTIHFLFNFEPTIPLFCWCSLLSSSYYLFSEEMETGGEEDELLEGGGVGGRGPRKRNKRGKRKKMGELTEEKQAERRAALAAKRTKKRELVKDLKARGLFKKAAAPDRSETAPDIPIQPEMETPGGATGKPAEGAGLTAPPSAAKPRVTPGSPKSGKKGAGGGRNLPTKESAAKGKSKGKGGKGKGKGKESATKLPKEGVSTPSLSQPKPPSERIVPTSLRITRLVGETARGDVEEVRRIFIEAAFNRPSSSTEGGPPAHIREVIFSDGAVAARVRDEVSCCFARAALEGSGFRAEILEGHLRMVFNVSTTWSGFPPERLMGILATHNPGLPEGALRYVSWVIGGSGNCTVFVDVSREGLIFLREKDFKLLALLETVKFRPAEK